MKKLLALIIAIVVVLALASCTGKRNNNTTDTTNKPTSDSTTVEDSQSTTEESTTESTTDDTTTTQEPGTTTDTDSTETEEPEAKEVEVELAEVPFVKVDNKWSLQIASLDADALAFIKANEATIKITIGGTTYVATSYDASTDVVKVATTFAPVVGRTYSDLKVEIFAGETLRFTSKAVPAFLATVGEFAALPTTRPETITIVLPEAGVWQVSEGQTRLFVTVSKEVYAAAKNAGLTWRFVIDGVSYTATAVSEDITSDNFGTLTVNLTSKGFVSQKDKAYTIAIEGVLGGEVVYKATTSAIATDGFDSVANLVVDKKLVSLYPEEANGMNPWYNGYGKVVVVFETWYINVDRYSELKLFMDGELVEAAVIDIQAMKAYGLERLGGDRFGGIVFDLATYAEGTHEFTGTIYNGTDLYTFTFEADISSADLQIEDVAIEEVDGKLALVGTVYGKTFEDLTNGRYGWTLLIDGEPVIVNPTVLVDTDNEFGRYTFDLSGAGLTLGETYTVDLAITTGRVNIYTYSADHVALKSYLKETEIHGYEQATRFNNDFTLVYTMPEADVTLIGGIAGYNWKVVIDGTKVYDVTPELDEGKLYINFEALGFIPEKNTKYTYELCAYKNGVVQYKTVAEDYTSSKGGVKVTTSSVDFWNRSTGFVDGRFNGVGKAIAWEKGRTFAMVDGVRASFVFEKSNPNSANANGNISFGIVNAPFTAGKASTLTIYAKWYGDDYYYVSGAMTYDKTSITYKSAEYKNGVLNVEFNEAHGYTVDQVIKGRVHDGIEYDFKVKAVDGNKVEFTLVPGKFETDEFFRYILKFDGGAKVWVVHVSPEDMATHSVTDLVYDAKWALLNANVALETREELEGISLITKYGVSNVANVYFANDGIEEYTWKVTITHNVTFPEAPETQTYDVEISYENGVIRFGLEKAGFTPFKGRTYTAVISGYKGDKLFTTGELTFTSNVGLNEFQTVDLSLDTFFPNLYPEGMTAMNFDVANKKIVTFFDNWYVQYDENTVAYVVVNGKLYNATLVLDEYEEYMQSIPGYFKGAVVSCEDLSELRPNTTHNIQLILVNGDETVRRRYVLNSSIETYAALDGTDKVTYPVPTNTELANLFDLKPGTSATIAKDATVEFTVEGPIHVKFFSLVTPAGVTAEFNKLPRAFKLEGFDTTKNEWETIATVTESEMVKNASEEYTYPTTTTTEFAKYRIVFTKADGDEIEIADIILYTTTTARGYKLYNNGVSTFISGALSQGGNTAEDASKLFDGRLDTKMLSNTEDASDNRSLFKTPPIFKTPEPIYAHKYVFTTGSDNYDGRNAKSWRIWGSKTGEADGYNWVLLDERTSEDLKRNYQNYEYEIQNKGYYQYYKIEFTGSHDTSNHGTGKNWIQLSRFMFKTADYAEQPTLKPITGLTPVSGPRNTESDSEGLYKLFDGNINTKLGAYSDSDAKTAIVFKTEEATTAKYYSFVTAGDNDWYKRIPYSWKFEASTDNETWVTLDVQTQARISANNKTEFVFEIANPGAYTYYRFTVTQHLDNMQLSEFRLYEVE